MPFSLYVLCGFLTLIGLMAWRRALVGVIPGAHLEELHRATCLYCGGFSGYRCTEARRLHHGVERKIPSPIVVAIGAVLWPLTVLYFVADSAAARLEGRLRTRLIVREQVRRDTAEIEKLVGDL